MPADLPDESTFYIQARSCMLWSLSTALSIWSKGQRPFLTRAQAQQSTELAKLHMRCYQYIAHVNLQAQLLRYHVRPKSHYFMHLAEHCQETLANPMSFANFVDEDQMKSLRGIIQSCHHSTLMQTWARKYILKKSLLWQRIAKDNRPPKSKHRP